MSPALIAAFVLGALLVGACVALLAGSAFERFVGLRYLVGRRASGLARIGLVVACALTAAGFAALILGGRSGQRALETTGVVVTLHGGLLMMVFLLLRVFSVFTTVSTMGIVLGVASLVVVLAVTSGFEREFKDKVLSVNAHLLIMDYGEAGMAEAQKASERYMKKLEGLPRLKRMALFSLSAGEVMIGKVGANLKGVDMARGTEDLKRWIKSGDAEALGKPARPCAPPRAPGFPVEDADEKAWTGRIVLGEELAQKLRVKKDSCVSVLVPIPQTGDVAAPPPVFQFRVVGTFRMGFHEYDTRLAFVSLEDAKVVGGFRQTIFGLELRFDDPTVALSAGDEIERRLGPDPPRVVNWKELNHNLFMALAMQKAIIALFLVLIIIVAAFNIVASLTMIVLGKVREIAILSSMGAGARKLRRIFVVAGTCVGFVGNALGVAYGLAVCGLASLYGYPLDPKVYLIAELPVQISIPELLFVVGATQAICVLATLYPAYRASRLKVVEGLRYM